MTTRREAELLERCIRLEAELLRAHGYAVPPLPDRDTFKRPARTYCVVTPALVAEMRNQHSQGMSPYRISVKLGCSHTTVRRYVEGK